MDVSTPTSPGGDSVHCDDPFFPSNFSVVVLFLYIISGIHLDLYVVIINSFHTSLMEIVPY